MVMQKNWNACPAFLPILQRLFHRVADADAFDDPAKLLADGAGQFLAHHLKGFGYGKPRFQAANEQVDRVGKAALNLRTRF